MEQGCQSNLVQRYSRGRQHTIIDPLHEPSGAGDEVWISTAAGYLHPVGKGAVGVGLEAAVEELGRRECIACVGECIGVADEANRKHRPRHDVIAGQACAFGDRY